jgi:hypothetical protein
MRNTYKHLAVMVVRQVTGTGWRPGGLVLGKARLCSFHTFS